MGLNDTYFMGIFQQDNADMPPYFKFLTIMAYYVFLKERIDVAVIEVGIGGQYDCTNVVRLVLVRMLPKTLKLSLIYFFSVLAILRPLA